MIQWCKSSIQIPK